PAKNETGPPAFLPAAPRESIDWIGLSTLGTVELQSERLHEEDRHLAARVEVAGAVVAVAAAARDALGGELIDEVDELCARAGDAVEDRGGARRRSISASVLALEQEHRHLAARDGVAGTVVAVAASARDALGRELVDPVDELARGTRHVREDGRG